VDYSYKIMNVIKNTVKQDGLTQQQFANKVGVSLPTLKRWLTGTGVTLQNLGDMCEVLGLSLSDVASQVDDENKKEFFYTDEQEIFFANNPDCFAYFDYLIKGLSTQKIRSKFQLRPKQITMYLSSLDRLNLIEWLPDNKAKLLVKGEPVWKKTGPLVKKYKLDIWNEFIQSRNEVNSSFYLHDYTKEDLERIKVKISELVTLTKAANKKVSITNQKSDAYGFFFCLQKYRWNLDQYLNKAK
jgi:transcriptional regulator with XRE-family HTH domain